MRGTRIMAALAAVVLGAGALVMVATAKEAAPGDKAPEFAAIPGVDGKELGSADFAEAKATVYVFTCNSCPVAVAYEDRFNAFAKKYKDKGVSLVAINVKGSENIDVMKQRADEKGFAFPYLYDASQESAKAFGAKVTPHVFVVDKAKQVRYVGAFDDDMENPTKTFVVDAVESILAGKEIAVTKTDPVGCGIGYKKR